MQFSADITLDDYREFIDFADQTADETNFWDRFSWRTQEWIRIALVVFSSAITVGAFSFLFHGKELDYWTQHPVSTVFVAIMLLLICLNLGAALETSASRLRDDGDKLDFAKLRDGFNFGEARFELRADRLRVAFALVRDSYVWQAFRNFGEGPNAFYLTFHEYHAIIVPKRAFADEAARQHFKEFAASHIGDRA